MVGVFANNGNSQRLPYIWNYVFVYKRQSYQVQAFCRRNKKKKYKRERSLLSTFSTSRYPWVL